MRVLMFGWEFPPYITGGLGTACQGIVEGLLQHGVETMFVVPRLFGNEDKEKYRLVSASEVPLYRTNPSHAQYLEQLQYLEINSPILPYVSPHDFATLPASEAAVEQSVVEKEGFHIPFSGGYNRDLVNEVKKYALVAAEIAIRTSHDVIHAHDWLTFPAGIAAREMSGKPLIVHVHATEFDRSGEKINSVVYNIERSGMEAADHIIAVSEFTKGIITGRYGIAPEKVSVVHNGVSTSQDSQIPVALPRKEKIVTYMGRITGQKGPGFFIEAAAKVLSRYPDVRFVMAGTGDLTTQMILKAAGQRIGSRFHFTGFLQGEEVSRMYAMSDVFVMPSVSEPFGITPLEAMKMNVPVIISKQSGVSEVVKNALRMDFWDTDAMADAIYALLRYPSLANTLATHGSQEVNTLSWMAAAGQINALYHTILKQ